MLFTFDVDETLLTEEMENEGQYVKGVIPTQILMDLESNGHDIAVVSPSPFLPKQYADDNHWFKRNGNSFCRLENIRDAQKYYKTDDKDTIYVDDLVGVLKMIMSQSKINCFTPEQFMKKFGN
jgi:hypothetical protein